MAIVNLQGSSYVAGTVSLPTGSEPEGVAVSPNGEYVYVTDYGTNKVSVIEPSLLYTPSGALIASIALPSGAEPDALAFSPDGDQLLVDDYGIGKISIIDTNPNDGTYDQVLSSPCVLSSCSSSAGPDAIAFSPSGAYAYVAAHVGDLSIFTQSGGSYALAASQGSLFTNVPTDVVIAPNDETAYVTDELSSGDGYLDEFSIDPANGEFESLNHVTVGTFPGAVTLSSDGATAYVADWASKYVSVVALATGAVTNVSVSSSSSNSISYVSLTPDSSEFVATAHGNPSTVYICATSDDDCSSPVDLGDNTSGDLTVAVGPAYYSPATQSVAGDEDDINPSVAASSQVDIEDGVDTASGSYTFNQDDLSLPDIGLSLDLSQEYDSSNAATNGPLVYGWSFSYGMTAHQVPDTASTNPCAIVVTQENGTPAVFDPPAWTTSCPPLSASYQPPTWEQASLSTLTDCNGTDSCWDMRRDNGTQYLIDQTTGDLISETDRNNNKVTLAYSGGKLSTVTGESGVRQLSFTWTGSNITEVTDSAGRTATFGYSSGNLTSLTLSASSTGDPTTHEWAFSYNSSHQLTDWWSPDNEAAYAGNTAEATQIAYNGAGQVTSVTDPAYLTQCNGSAGPPYCAPETTFSYPSFDTTTETGTVLIADPNENCDLSADVNGGDGNVTLDRYSDGVLVQQVQGYGYETSSTSPYDQYAMATDATATVPDPYVLEATESIDGDGNLTTTNFDMMGNPIYVTDPMGNVTEYVYNSFNEIEVELAPSGVEQSNTYDSHGNELTSIDGNGNITTYRSFANGELCATLSPNGYANGSTLASCPSGPEQYVTLFSYDAEGDLVSTTDPDGNVSTSLFNAAGEDCADLSADGYSKGDRLPSSCPETSGPFETAYLGFSLSGSPLEKVGPTNTAYGAATWRSTYDPDGHLVASATPLANPECNPVTDGTCAYTSYMTYGPDGYEATDVEPPTGAGLQSVTTYFYDPDGNQIADTEPDGDATTCDPLSSRSCAYTSYSGYNNLAQLVDTEVAGEDPTTFTYDPAGNQLSEVTPPTLTAPHGITTEASYDANGQVLTEEDTLGEEATFAYNADGMRVCSTDPLETSLGYSCDQADPPTSWSPGITFDSYDGDGNLTEETTPALDSSGAGYDAWYYYDADGNEIAGTDATGNGGGATGAPASGSPCNPVQSQSCAGTTYWTYDPADRLVSEKVPPNPSAPSTFEATTYGYDQDANEVTIQDPDGNLAANSFNGADEYVGTTYSAGSSADKTAPSVSYTPNADGTIATMTDGTGTSTYSYNQQGQVTSFTSGAGATSTYGYDASGNLECLSYPGAALADFCSNLSPPPTSCSSEASTPALVVEYQTYPSGPLCKVSDWLGNTFTYSYDAALENISVQVDGNTADVLISNSFDAVGRLTGTDASSGTTTLLKGVYTYNPDGSVLTNTPTVQSVSGAVETQITYNDADQPISYSLPNHTAIAYGNASSGTDGELSSDVAQFTDSASLTGEGATGNQLCWTLSSGSSGDLCSTAPAGATTYSYDADGSLVGEGGANDETLGYDSLSGQLSCLNTAGASCSLTSPTATTTTYLYDGDGDLSQSSTGATEAQTTDAFSWGGQASPELLATTLAASGSQTTTDYIYGASSTPLEQISTAGSGTAADLLTTNQDASVDGLIRLSGSSSNSLVNVSDYGPYGEPESDVPGVADYGLNAPNPQLTASFTDTTVFGLGGGITVPGQSEASLIAFPTGVYDSAAAEVASMTRVHFAFTPGLARQYANKWAYGENWTKFPVLLGRGGDCTNYVSQALLAGGVRMYGVHGFWWQVIHTYDTDPRHWWVAIGIGGPFSARSDSWSVASDLYHWITTQGVGILVATWLLREPSTNVMPDLPADPSHKLGDGDPIFIHFSEQKPYGEPTAWTANHTTVVDDWWGRAPSGVGTLVDQHSPRRRGVIWTLYPWMAPANVTGGTKYWCVHINSSGWET
ncbi:MAG: amidase domain-containing protein [Acidimicrobiales bacterium]